MKLVEINWQPSERQLRQFGLICMIALPFVGWLWSAERQTMMILGGVGLALAAVGLIVPKVLKPIFLGLMLIALPIGLVVSEVALALIYYGVFLPIGICFKVARRDALKRTIERGQESYWEEKTKPADVASYYRQW